MENYLESNSAVQLLDPWDLEIPGDFFVKIDSLYRNRSVTSEGYTT